MSDRLNAEEQISYFPFEKLEVYRLAVGFATQIYSFTDRFPQGERFGLTNQIRRASISIGLNIAEGRGRGGDREFVRFLLIARGSLFEVISAAEIAAQLHYLAPEDHQAIRAAAQELNAKLMALIKKLAPESV